MDNFTSRVIKLSYESFDTTYHIPQNTGTGYTVSNSGPVWSKTIWQTTLARLLFPGYRYINFESFEEREFVDADVKGFLERLKREQGVILDEIQKAPKLLSYLQMEVDENPIPGRFIITGSQNILLNQHVSQTLAGRVAITTLLPLSIEELRKAGLLPETATKAIFQGCYPRIYHNKTNPVVFAESYMRTYIEKDVRDMKHITSLTDFQKFMRLCAGRIGQLLNMSALAVEAGLSLATVKSWLSILEASYVIFLLQPHYNNFNKRIVKTPKLYFYDTSLACNLLRLTNEDDVYEHYLRGGLFESFILADLIKKRYNDCLPPNAYFWRDKSGNEVDCILEMGKQNIPIEIKSGATISSDMFEGITKWCQLSKTNPSHGKIIYAGDEEQKRITGHILPWSSL